MDYIEPSRYGIVTSLQHPSMLQVLRSLLEMGGASVFAMFFLSFVVRSTADQAETGWGAKAYQLP